MFILNVLLIFSIAILGSYASPNDCNVLRKIFSEYKLDAYWDLGTADCCNNYKDFEYPVVINCDQDDRIIKLQMTNLFLDNYLLTDKFCDLKSLVSLSLPNNGFIGDIPECLTSITSLEYLDLGDNYFYGKIPKSIGKLKKLKELTLSNNRLIGGFPDELGNLSSLTNLYIDTNQLSGPLPHTLSNLRSIKSFDVSDNNFTGDLPGELYNMKTLEYAYFNNNGFTGTIDRNIGSLNLLVELDLTNNQFTGKIPSTIGFLQNLEWLSLAGNQFNGDFPANIAKSKYLLYLDLRVNSFTSMPTSLKRLSNLNYIDLRYNPHLKGQIHLSNKAEDCFIDPNVCVEGGICKGIVTKCKTSDNNDFDKEAENEEKDAGFEDKARDDANEKENDTTATVPNGKTIVDKDKNGNETCWASIHGYPCCEGKALNKVYVEDVDGKWGFDFKTKSWCGISSYSEINAIYENKASSEKDCWSHKEGYSCCIGCTVFAETESGSWGVEHNKWCGIPRFCSN